MINPPLNRTHQPLEMTPQHSQAPRIQQQPIPSAASGRARRARRPARAGRRARMPPPARGRRAVRIVRVCATAAAGGRLRGEGDLLVLAQDVQLAGGETELRVRD